MRAMEAMEAMEARPPKRKTSDVGSPWPAEDAMASPSRWGKGRKALRELTFRVSLGPFGVFGGVCTVRSRLRVLGVSGGGSHDVGEVDGRDEAEVDMKLVKV
jgi:hypothetical protein